MKHDDVDFELNDNGKSYVQVDDDLRLIMSPRNWQLQKLLIAQSDTKSQKKGTETWSSFRYYMTLENALKDIIHIKTSRQFFKSSEGMLKANEAVINSIKEAFSPEYKITKTN